MSFSSGFNAGYSVFTDFAKLGMQKERMQIEEDVEFGFYSDENGQRLNKTEAFTEEGQLKEGLKFNPGRSQLRAEQVDNLAYQNSDTFRELSEKIRESDLDNKKQLADSRRIMNTRNMGIDQATELYSFYEEFNPIIEDPKTWSNYSEIKKDAFTLTIATRAKDFENRFGFDPLALFKDSMIPGYQAAAELTNMIQKNPSSIETLDLNSYSEGLNNLFELQTSKYKGKKFKDGEKEGTVEGVKIDFTNYEIDPDTNKVIFNAVYDVSFGEEDVQQIAGVLNDTNRSVIDPNLSADDRVAFSLTDLLDYTSASNGMMGFIANPKNAEAVNALRDSALRKATLYDRVDLGTANRVNQQIENLYADELRSISSRFKSADIDVLYQEVFDNKNNQENPTFVNSENKLVAAIVNNLSPIDRNKLLDVDDAKESGYKLKRNKDNEIMPYYDFKFLVHRSKDVIREQVLSGASSNITNNPLISGQSAITFTFQNLPDFTLNSDIQAIEDSVDPSTYESIQNYLVNQNLEVNTENVLTLLSSIEQSNLKEGQPGVKARGGE